MRAASCFETHRSGLYLRKRMLSSHAAMLLSMRPRESCAVAPRSLRARHSGLLQDFGPAHGFRLDEAVKRLGRAFTTRNELKADKLLFDLGLGDGRIHRVVELRDDLRWRPARRCDRLPGRPVEARHADVGALRRRHAERAQLARL